MVFILSSSCKLILHTKSCTCSLHIYMFLFTESSSASSSSSTETSSSEESEPVYQLRERRCANRYKFNDYDAMINAAIQDEVEAVQGAGNQGRGKDIATIVNAEKEEAQVN